MEIPNNRNDGFHLWFHGAHVSMSTIHPKDMFVPLVTMCISMPSKDRVECLIKSALLFFHIGMVGCGVKLLDTQ